MGVRMEAIVLAFGTALVGAAATDSWQQVHDAIAGLWHRARLRRQAVEIPGGSEEEISSDLTVLREQVLQARRNDDAATERALEGAWQLKLQQLLEDDPSLAAELKEVLDRVLAPALTSAEQSRVRSIVMHATSRDSSTMYQIGVQFNDKSGS